MPVAPDPEAREKMLAARREARKAEDRKCTLVLDPNQTDEADAEEVWGFEAILLDPPNDKSAPGPKAEGA